MEPISSPIPMRGTRRKWLIVACVLLAAVGAAAAWILWPLAPQTSLVAAKPRAICLSFSPDRSTKYLAATFSDGRLRVWEPATQREIPVKLPSKWPLNDLAWLSDGSAVLTGGFEQHILLWNLKQAQARKLPTFDAPIESLAVRPKKSELLVSLSTGKLCRVDLQTGDREFLSTGHTGIVKVVRYHPNGLSFVTAGADQKLVWHDAETRLVTKTVAAHQHEISSLAFSRNGTQLVSGSWDNSAKIWPANGGDTIATLTHPDGVAQVDWQDDTVVTSCWDHRLRVWNTGTAEVIQERDCQSDTLSFAIWPGHREVAEIDSSGNLQLIAP